MTKLFIFAGIFTFICNFINIFSAKAEDVVVITETTAHTTSLDVVYVPGNTDICSHKDKNTLECVRVTRGQKPIVFTVKTKKR
jgi:hypothetical protein